MQLLGPTFSEKTLLRVGRWYEQAHGWAAKRPGLCA
jgi:Asp-tRNA(Asn)/Glu-tRNA(Gln) amidotransferase A subunit family amidase